MGKLQAEDDRTHQLVNELESRLVVLEIISMSALAMALDTSEGADPGQARALAGLIIETVEQRCQELGFGDHARKAATGYAERLMGTAVASLYPTTQ
ncbi:hypothetical protein [Rhizobium sp. SL86]|jgi:hypothetical protein|uniref:hypothetical protein n=1 Tax=Rhizobium sp. SL86 TaxID=2995148 RepID=UPI002276F1C6|nr:hypothetical protein [Rhizobium sp. SL86]MCY1665187.1 hypothetical protein [Rhizobium sp. SL86]